MSVQEYKQEQRFETFSYLPSMSSEDIRAQITYMIQQGWNPAIEHCDPKDSFNYYWFMWKLPFFGEQSVDSVLQEVEACHREYPNHHIRLLAYDNYTQSQGTSFVVYRG